MIFIEKWPYLFCNSRYLVERRFSSGKVAMDVIQDAYALALILGAGGHSLTTAHHNVITRGFS